MVYQADGVDNNKAKNKKENEMSHVSKYSTIIRDTSLFCNKAEKLGHEVIQGDQIVKLFSTLIACVASVKVKGWCYPLAITEAGEILYDHFGSQQGSMENFHGLIKDYNEEMVIQNIPIDLIQTFYTEDIKEGTKLVLEYK